MVKTMTTQVIILLLLYFIPYFVAENRKHHNRMAISVLNLFLGWTVLGWLIALIWACTAVKKDANMVVSTQDSSNNKSIKEKLKGINWVGVIITIIITFCIIGVIEQNSDKIPKDNVLPQEDQVGSLENDSLDNLLEEPEELKFVDEKPLSISNNEAEILAEIKSEAQSKWGNDYSMQEYWIKKQMSAYHYMKQLPDNEIKQESQNKWYNDYSMQKYWYDKQIKAKERLHRY